MQSRDEHSVLVTLILIPYAPLVRRVSDSFHTAPHSLIADWVKFHPVMGVATHIMIADLANLLILFARLLAWYLLG